MLGQSNTREGADEPYLDVKQVRLVHIVAAGRSARMFLTKHFQRLRSEGFLVTLVCSGGKDGRFCATDSGVTHIPVSIKQHVSPFSDILSLFQLWRVLRRLRPTIVHTHMAKAGLLGAIAGRLAGVPIRIYHNHGMSFLSARGWRRWFLKVIDKVACRFATNVLYCAPSNLDDAVANGLVSRKKGRVAVGCWHWGLQYGKFLATVALFATGQRGNLMALRYQRLTEAESAIYARRVAAVEDTPVTLRGER